MNKDLQNKLLEHFKSSEIVYANGVQNMNEHWDIQLNQRFDMRKLKKVRRGDSEVNENFHYVELKNVQGKNGWLYGKTNFFAFETYDYWIIIEKEKLQDFIKNKCKDKIRCETPTLYQLYTRKNRMDIIVLVKTIDLMAIAKTVINK